MPERLTDDPRAMSAWLSPQMRAVLRVHPEPWQHLDDWAVHELLATDPRDYLSHLRARLEQLADGRLELQLPPKQIFTDESGDFRVMPCVTGSGSSAVKTVKIVGTNLRQRTVPDQITVGKALRLDPLENFVTHVYDACLLSSARTGACAVVALARLARDVQRVGIVGCGRVAAYVAVYLAVSEPVELIVYDVRAERARRLAAALRSGGAACRAADWETTIGCDALVLATPSHRVLVEPASTAAEVVVSVGADACGQHELSPEWAAAADVFIDSIDALDVGDLVAWRQLGLLPVQPPTLIELFRSSFAPPRGRCVFVSTGSALLDNLTVDYLLQQSAL